MSKHAIKLCTFEKLWIAHGTEELSIGAKKDHLSERKYSVKERKSHKQNHCFIMSGHDYKEV